jgi:hypothetical protein
MEPSAPAEHHAALRNPCTHRGSRTPAPRWEARKTCISCPAPSLDRRCRGLLVSESATHDRRVTVDLVALCTTCGSAVVSIRVAAFGGSESQDVALGSCELRRGALTGSLLFDDSLAQRLLEGSWLEVEERHSGRVCDGRVGGEPFDQRPGNARVDRCDQADPM